MSEIYKPASILAPHIIAFISEKRSLGYEQPRLADFGASGEDEQAVGQDFLNREAQRLELPRHESVAVKGGEGLGFFWIHAIFFSELAVPAPEWLA